jgi:hypothetical protein
MKRAHEEVRMMNISYEAKSALLLLDQKSFTRELTATKRYIPAHMA